MRYLEPIDHRPGCHSQSVTEPTLTRDGRPIVRCTYCHRVAAVDLEPEQLPEPEPAPLSPYRCRDHDEPVTWKGTGCPACARALTRRRESKDERRRADALEDWPTL